MNVHEFDALAAAVNPSWHLAIQRLTKVTSKLEKRLTVWMSTPSDGKGNLVQGARDLAETLIEFLDEVDDYAQTEREEAADDVACDDDEREASFCGVFAAGTFTPGIHDDEAEADYGNGQEADYEPSLGSPDIPPTYSHYNRHFGLWVTLDGDQSHWSAGATDDTEDQCEDEGGQCEDEGAENTDREPSLGWPERMVQGASLGNAEDMESSLPIMGGAA